MKFLPEFFVFSSPVENEENPNQESCFIAIDIREGINEFCDYVEKNTLLAVDGYRKMGYFFFTFDRYTNCYLVEVHLKEESDQLCVISCEQVAVAETYAFLSQRAVIKE